MMNPRPRPRTGPGGFTLIELLVVVAIIALISAVALPTILPALNERRVSEGARLLQAVLAGTRDAAIRANKPRGIRLLPDPVFNGQLAGDGQSYNALASNRFIPIEPGPDYTEGLVTAVTSTDPYYNSFDSTGHYLALRESGYTTNNTVSVPNNPTNWALNVRQGDKIRFNDSGAFYTIAGPVNGYQFAAGGNSERVISFANTGYKTSPPLYSSTGWLPEFLYLTNGIDDNGNGWIDESCDGIDNDGDGVTDPGFNGLDDDGVNGIDDPAELIWTFGTYSITSAEYEQEVFVGSQASIPPLNQAYTISRRPVVSPGSRETTLPAGVVVDLTGWNFPAATPPTAYQNNLPVLLPERSRLPVDASTYTVDIMIDQTGRVITPGAGMDGGGYYGNSPLSSLPFYHFWITEREGVVKWLFGPRTVNNQPINVPALNPNYGAAGTATNYILPMPQGTAGYSPAPVVDGVPVYLTGERRLVTLFVKTGQISSNSIQYFNALDTNRPFYDAQSGIKESQ